MFQVILGFANLIALGLCICACAHPVVEFRGELGQEAADGSFAVVSLYKHLCDQRCTVPQLLKVMELNEGHVRSANVGYVCQNTKYS